MNSQVSYQVNPSTSELIAASCHAAWPMHMREPVIIVYDEEDIMHDEENITHDEESITCDEESILFSKFKFKGPRLLTCTTRVAQV